MREIKFRAWYENKMWDIENKQDITGFKCTNGKINGVFLDGDYCSIEECVLMEYTGLKDKNGKKIFECDILDGPCGRHIIKWGEDVGVGYGFTWGAIDDFLTESITGFIDEYEVIGNVYEHKYLLK